MKTLNLKKEAIVSDDLLSYTNENGELYQDVDFRYSIPLNSVRILLKSYIDNGQYNQDVVDYLKDEKTIYFALSQIANQYLYCRKIGLLKDNKYIRFDKQNFSETDLKEFVQSDDLSNDIFVIEDLLFDNHELQEHDMISFCENHQSNKQTEQKQNYSKIIHFVKAFAPAKHNNDDIQNDFVFQLNKEQDEFKANPDVQIEITEETNIPLMVDETNGWVRNENTKHLFEGNEYSEQQLAEKIECNHKQSADAIQFLDKILK